MMDAKLIRAAWCRDTSVDPEHWTRVDPAYGQDDVTALVLQDYAGGDILTCEIAGMTHFWNRVPDGEVEMDMTIARYGGASTDNATLADSVAMRDDPEIRRRYDLMARRVHDAAFIHSMTSEEFAGPEYEAEQ